MIFKSLSTSILGVADLRCILLDCGPCLSSFLLRARSPNGIQSPFASSLEIPLEARKLKKILEQCSGSTYLSHQRALPDVRSSFRLLLSPSLIFRRIRQQLLRRYSDWFQPRKFSAVGLIRSRTWKELIIGVILFRRGKPYACVSTRALFLCFHYTLRARLRDLFWARFGKLWRRHFVD